MSHFPMPLRDFRFMTDAELEKFDPLRDISEEPGPGYALCVTLEYPPGLHFDHSSFPLACEQLDITEDDLSPYARECMSVLSGGRATKHRSRKLTATFNRRTQYWTHGIALKFYLQQGLKLVKIHRGITFHQEPFLKKYIDKCTARRAASKTKWESNLWKLLSNR